jgi:hypothetical protein
MASMIIAPVLLSPSAKAVLASAVSLAMALAWKAIVAAFMVLAPVRFLYALNMPRDSHAVNRGNAPPCIILPLPTHAACRRCA